MASDSKNGKRRNYANSIYEEIEYDVPEWLLSTELLGPTIFEEQQRERRRYVFGE